MKILKSLMLVLEFFGTIDLHVMAGFDHCSSTFTFWHRFQMISCKFMKYQGFKLSLLPQGGMSYPILQLPIAMLLYVANIFFFCKNTKVWQSICWSADDLLLLVKSWPATWQSCEGEQLGVDYWKLIATFKLTHGFQVVFVRSEGSTFDLP